LYSVAPAVFVHLNCGPVERTVVFGYTGVGACGGTGVAVGVLVGCGGKYSVMLRLMAASSMYIVLGAGEIESE